MVEWGSQGEETWTRDLGHCNTAGVCAREPTIGSMPSTPGNSESVSTGIDTSTQQIAWPKDMEFMSWIGLVRCALRHGATAALATALVVCARSSHAQNGSPTEYQLKAVFLFNFAKFIDWPPESFESPQAPFSICVIGKDPFGRAIDDELQGKTIGSRPVAVQRMKDAASARHCQIAFVGAPEDKSLSGVVEALRGTNVLLVGESGSFATTGGTIQFTLEENHVRFLINTDAADRAGLKFSSKLLALAKIVHDGAGDRKN
jgi:hypothetical protein